MMKRTLHTTLLLALVLLPLSCRREPPVGTEAFRLEFPLPEDCLPDAFYAGRKVTLRGPLEYTFETDARGGVNVESVIPGIYDIVTGIELSGAEYKALLRVPVALEDNAQVHIGASRMNCRIFEAADLRIPLSASVLKSLLIAKIYYSGTRDNMDRTYTTDSYVEIFNNSDEVQYMDGKYLGLAESVSPAAYPAKDNPDSIYLRQVCRFPGKGTDYPVAPGGSVVIAARSARDHRTSAATSVDLSGADFEVKAMEGSGNPDVPMLPLVSNSTNILTLNLISGGLNAVVLFETDEDVLAWPEVYQRGKTSGEMFRRPLKADGHGAREMGEEVDRPARHGVRLVEHNRHLAARRRNHRRQAGVGSHRQKRIRLETTQFPAAAPERAQVGEEVLHGQRTRPGGEHRPRPTLEHARLDIASAHPDRHVMPARRQFRRNRESREGMASRSSARDDQLEPHVDSPREEPMRQRPRAVP